MQCDTHWPHQQASSEDGPAAASHWQQLQQTLPQTLLCPDPQSCQQQPTSSLSSSRSHCAQGEPVKVPQRMDCLPQLSSCTACRHDAEVFGLAIPALGSIMLDPVMSLVDTGVVQSRVDSLFAHLLPGQAPEGRAAVQRWLGSLALRPWQAWGCQQCPSSLAAPSSHSWCVFVAAWQVLSVRAYRSRSDGCTCSFSSPPQRWPAAWRERTLRG